MCLVSDEVKSDTTRRLRIPDPDTPPGLFSALLAMPTAYPLPSNVSPATVANTASFIRIVTLALISGAAIASRLFAVINFESIIHEL